MDINAFLDETLLHMASDEDRGVAIAKFFLKNAKKLNINAKAQNYYGETVLQVAEKQGEDEIATLIRNYMNQN